MTDEQMREAVALARDYTERCDEWPVADFPLDHDKSNLLARALLAASARLTAADAVVTAAREFYSVRTGMHTNGAQHTKAMRDTRVALEAAFAALDAQGGGER